MPTPRNRQVDAVLFDFGGVLMRNARHSNLTTRFPEHQRARAQELMLGNFAEDTDHPWHRLERGEITLEECRSLTDAVMRAEGIEAATGPIRLSSGDDAETTKSFRVEIDQDMVQLVTDLRAHDIRVGLLTNNIREFRPVWRAALAIDDLFDDVVDSHEVGIRKPNPAIYELALQRLGASAQRTAFLDDLQQNVTAAEQVGIIGVLVHEDSTFARQTTARLAGL